MDINKLGYFFAAAELQNFTKAADRCNIAQTTMSKYIVSLEAEAGVPLFNRTNKGCYLTEQGRLFYTEMKKIYSEYNEVLSNLLADEKAELRLGICGAFFKLSTLQAFESAYRNVTISITAAPRDKLLDDLRRQHIHAVILPDVITTEILIEDDLVTTNLMSEESLLTYSALTRDSFATVGDMLETLPFITKTSSRSYHEYCRELLYNRFGAHFKDVQVVESASIQQLLVSLSQGFAIMPASEIAAGLDLRQESIGKDVMETLVLLHNRNHVTAHLKEFIRFTKSHRS